MESSPLTASDRGSSDLSSAALHGGHRDPRRADAAGTTGGHAFGCDLPSLKWGHDPDQKSQALVSWCGNHVKSGENRPRVGKAAASRTPEEFKQVLIAMARSARPHAEVA